MACESRELSGRPVNRWTHRELADEVVRRGIVPSISVSQVGRYLAQAEWQPHRGKYWLNTKERDPEVFEQQVQIVCQTYLEAPNLYFQENTHTVSVDETVTYLLRRDAEFEPSPAIADEDLAPTVLEAWHALLADARFLPQGGIVGYPCCHLYHQDARFQVKQTPLDQRSANMLKGRDQLLAATALQAGLDVSFAPYLFEDCIDETWQLDEPADKPAA